MRSSVHLRRTAALLIVSLCLGGCTSSGPDHSASSDAEPVRVRAIAGTDLNRVVLSESAVRNLGIRTDQVRRARAASRGSTRTPATGATFIPMTAVVYDPQGSPWAYTTPAARTFVRVPIVIDHIVGGAAYLRSGPTAGTAVVTVGASELLGTEYGVGGE